MEITLAKLKKLKACEDQVKLFKETFGKSLVLTEAVCREHAGKFDIFWLAKNILKGAALSQFQSTQQKAREQYQSIRLPAYEQYQSIRQQAYEQYLSIAQQTWEQYESIAQQALEQYLSIAQQTWEQYRITIALALMKLMEYTAKSMED